MIRQTSLMAYEELDPAKMSAVYREIIQTIRELGPSTDQEIGRHLGYGDPNKIRPRRNELVASGWIQECGSRACRVSGKTAIAWCLK